MRTLHITVAIFGIVASLFFFSLAYLGYEDGNAFGVKVGAGAGSIFLLLAVLLLRSIRKR